MDEPKEQYKDVFEFIRMEIARNNSNFSIVASVTEKVEKNYVNILANITDKEYLKKNNYNKSPIVKAYKKSKPEAKEKIKILSNDIQKYLCNQIEKAISIKMKDSASWSLHLATEYSTFIEQWEMFKKTNKEKISQLSVSRQQLIKNIQSILAPEEVSVIEKFTDKNNLALFKRFYKVCKKLGMSCEALSKNHENLKNNMIIDIKRDLEIVNGRNVVVDAVTVKRAIKGLIVKNGSLIPQNQEKEKEKEKEKVKITAKAKINDFDGSDMEDSSEDNSSSKTTPRVSPSSQPSSSAVSTSNLQPSSSRYSNYTSSSSMSSSVSTMNNIGILPANKTLDLSKSVQSYLNNDFVKYFDKFKTSQKFIDFINLVNQLSAYNQNEMCDEDKILRAEITQENTDQITKIRETIKLMRTDPKQFFLAVMSKDFSEAFDKLRIVKAYEGINVIQSELKAKLEDFRKGLLGGDSALKNTDLAKIEEVIGEVSIDKLSQEKSEKSEKSSGSRSLSSRNSDS